MISQGAVKGSISLMVRQAEGQKAARALHRELFEGSKGVGEGLGRVELKEVEVGRCESLSG